MYSSYNGVKGRSKSTLDVFRTVDDTSQQPSIGSATMSYHGRHRRIPEPSQIKRARSYLSDDIRRQFELGFEKSTPAAGTAATAITAVTTPHSPRSSSFVKRLVATLERKQREDLTQYARVPSADIYGAPYRQSSKDYAKEIVTISNPKPDKEKIFLERFNSDLTLPRPVRRQLENVPERDNEDENENEDGVEEDEYEEEDEDDETEDEGEPLPLEYGGVVASTKRPREGSSTLVAAESLPKASARRLLKSFLSTIVSWRGAKTLPRGSRDYYATRESLGEEMRAFRRDTMPRLIERAALADRFQPNPNDQREFAKLIGASSRHLDDGPVSSIATIRPAYGNNAVARQRRTSCYQEQAPSDASLYATRRTIQPPAAPRRTSSAQRTDITEQMPRPYKLKDLGKREDEPSVQLRRQPGLDVPVIYDVPRSNRRVVYPHATQPLPPPLRTPPEYENISGIIHEDRRLRCTMFTTF